MISEVVKPNLAESPPELAHLPEPRVYNLALNPIQGQTPVSLATRKSIFNSFNFSTTITTRLPDWTASEANLQNASSLKPLQISSDSGV